MKLTIIGAGKMGEAIIAGLHKDYEITVFEKDEKRVHEIKNRYNVQAFVSKKGDKRSAYTPADLEYIAQYTGSGGHGKEGGKGEGLLYEFYTPDYICDLMYQQALAHVLPCLHLTI
jgi:shikimate 5-dehydrogenase